MNEKKPYRVRLVYDGVAVGVDSTYAQRAFERAIRSTAPGEGSPDPVDSRVAQLTSLAELPEGWSGESLPFGHASERKIVDWLYATERLALRGEPEKLATFIESMRGFAQRTGVELIAVPADEKEEKE